MKTFSFNLKKRLFLFDEKQRLIKKIRKMSQKNTFNSMNVKTSQNFQSFVSALIEVFAFVSSSIDQQIKLFQQLQQLVQAFITEQILQTYRFSHKSSHSYVQQFSLSMLILSHELYFSFFFVLEFNSFSIFNFVFELFQFFFFVLLIDFFINDFFIIDFFIINFFIIDFFIIIVTKQ